MTFEEAVRILGPEGVRQAEELAESLPPLTDQQIDAVARILHSSSEARRSTAAHADPQQQPGFDAA